MSIQNLFKKGTSQYIDYLKATGQDFPEAGAEQTLGRGFSTSILEPESTFGAQPDETPLEISPQKGQEELSLGQKALDVVLAPIRGSINTFDSIMDLVDEYTPGDWWQYNSSINNALPDWLAPLGEDSKTIAGGFIEGASQFVTGFLGYGLGTVGLASRAMGLRNLARLKGPTSTFTKTGKYVAKPILAGAITDFTAFDGQGERLADLVESNENLSNSITRFLQYEGNETDSEFKARFKNVLEGLALEGVAGALLFSIARSIKGIRKYRLEKEKGASLEEAGQKGIDEINSEADDLLIQEVEDNSRFKEVSKDVAKEEVKRTESGVDYQETLGIEDEAPADTGVRNIVGEESDVFDPFDKDKVDASQETINKKYEDKLNSIFAARQGEFLFVKNEKGGTDMIVPKKRGGDVAVESSWKPIYDLITDPEFTKEMGASADLLAGNVAATKFIQKNTNITDLVLSDDILQGAQHVAERSGNVKLSLKKLKELEDVSVHEEWLASNTASYLILRKASEEVVSVAQRWKTDPKNKQALIEIAESLTYLDEASRVNSIRARRDGQGLLTRKFYKRGTLKGGFQNKRFKTKIPRDGKATVEDYEKFIQERLGKGSIEKLINRLAALNSYEGVQQLARVQRLAKKSAGRKLLDITTEYWINAILSGPATQTVNLFGNALTNALLVGEKTVGALLSGDVELARATMGFAMNAETFKGSLDAARLAIIDDEARLMAGNTAFDDSKFKERAITAEGMPFLKLSDDSAAGTAVNYLGMFARIPGRALLGGDEFFKNLAYRQYVKTELALEGFQKNLRGQELAKYVEGEFESLLFKDTGAAYTRDGQIAQIKKDMEKEGFKYGEGFEEEFAERLDKMAEINTETGRGALAEKAMEFARKATFTSNPNELSPIFQGISKVGNVALQQHPYLRFIAPFLRTPLNILNFGLERTAVAPVFAVSKEYRDKIIDTLKNGTRQQKAEIKGRMATSAAATGFMLYYLFSNEEFITGGGPTNRKEKDILRESGWQPYSIKVKDKYISYQRLDPIATILSMGADLRDHIKYENPNPNEGPTFPLYAVAARSYAVNLTDKTFLKGVNNLFNVLRDPEYYGPKLFKDIGGGFVPNILNQSKNLDAEIVVRESRTISDNLLRRVPDFEQNVAPKRTVLGEELTRENFLGQYGVGIFNPFYVSTEKKDKLSKEMASLSYGFSMPSKTLFGIPEINLTEIKSTKGNYDAYDRLLELSSKTKINGKTLKQSLNDLVKSKEYQKISQDKLYETTGRRSPRIEIMQKVINAYRSKARGQLLKENPDIQEMFKKAMQGRAAYQQTN